jgi:hemerythrin
MPYCRPKTSVTAETLYAIVAVFCRNNPIINIGGYMCKNDSFSWSKDYVLSIKKIDDQHKELLRLLKDTLRFPAGHLYFPVRFNSIKKSIEKHYKTEEEILERSSYGKLMEHKLEHKNIFEELEQIYESIEEKIEKEFNEIIINIRIKLLTHLKNYDIPAKKYFEEGLKNKGV